jgi:hypothetical protein
MVAPCHRCPSGPGTASAFNVFAMARRLASVANIEKTRRTTAASLSLIRGTGVGVIGRQHVVAIGPAAGDPTLQHTPEAISEWRVLAKARHLNASHRPRSEAPQCHSASNQRKRILLTLDIWPNDGTKCPTACL